MQVEKQPEGSAVREWQVIGSSITRETLGIDLCDLKQEQFYLLKMTAITEAGSTSVLYRVRVKTDGVSEG